MGKESRIALEIRASGADILEGLFPGASPKVLWSMPIYNFAISYGKSAAGQKDACPRTFWRQGKFILKCIVCLLSYMTTLQMASAQDVIDVQAHIIPQLIGVGKAEHHNALMAEGFPLPKWTIENQLKWMDDAGVRTSVLSLAAPQPYFGDAKESAIIVRQLNEESARAKAEHSGTLPQSEDCHSSLRSLFTPGNPEDEIACACHATDRAGRKYRLGEESVGFLL